MKYEGKSKLFIINARVVSLKYNTCIIVIVFFFFIVVVIIIICY